MADTGGRAVERKVTLPVTPDATMIGVKPLFKGSSLDDGANADFDVVMAAPDGKTIAQKGLKYELLKIETSYQWYRQNGQWQFEPIKRTERVANGTIDDDRRQAGAPVAAGAMGPLSPGGVDRRSQRPDHLATPSMPASTPKPAPTRRTCWRSRSTRAQVPERRHHERGGDRAHRRPPDGQRVHRPAGGEQGAGGQGRHRTRCDQGRQGLGHRRLCGRHLAPAARRAGQAHARPRHRRAVVRHRPRGAHARHEHEAAGGAAPAIDPRRAGAGRRLQARR